MFSLFKRNKEIKPDISHRDDYGYLGKTELRPDFIKFQVNSREAVALDHWVKEGFAYASRHTLPNHKINLSFGLTNLFFMAGNESEVSLVGVITPSVDSSGRHYPFVSFVNIGQELYRMHPSALFLNESNDFHHLHQVSDAVFTAKNNDEMATNADKLSQVVHAFKQPVNINKLLEKFRHIPMDTLWKAIAIEDTDARALLIQESSLVLQSIANRGCLRSQQGLRFPMPNLDNGFELIASFWLHLVTVIVADHNWRPWVFYQVGRCGKPASLTIFTTPVPPSYFDSIWSETSTNQSVIDLSMLETKQALSESSVALAKMNNASMYDALRRWCKA